jgi:hypothetical protein
MKKYILFTLSILLFSSCSLFSPSVITIKNQSDYSVKVSNNQNSVILAIPPNKKDHFEILPGEITINIETSAITSSRKITVDYLENIEIIYNLE